MYTDGMKILADAPNGCLYYFNNPDEVRAFIALCFNIDSYPYLGVSFEPNSSRDPEEVTAEFFAFDDDESEMVDGTKSVWPQKSVVIPYHDPNTFYTTEELEPAYVSSRSNVDPDEVILGPYWEDMEYPCVGYFYFEDSFDRMGDTTVRLMNVSPVASMNTVHMLKAELNSEKTKARIQTLNKYIAYEEARDAR